ncbi:DUF3800 domain-containing protein [Roseivirga thermotolerans]|uniref:3-deoxy-D-manno-octulosonic acid transferase n=1 Tax=Roseivirga thermotolerans TaxID=1758176 RepID=A0ABQ3I434_9BACT|nr:DUF3800 domain-containing protein [Roseivirga thermotolerans]GHE52223.1 3-deoxy-D-manno-octulosonic acid transferase [Roseivirga thermotolerans]
MKYYLFIDESGDANILNPDPKFDVFVLCGVLFNSTDYLWFDAKFKELKKNFFGTEGIVFHSYEIRQLKGPFAALSSSEIKSRFYSEVGEVITQSRYTVFASIIKKKEYRVKYRGINEAYESSLMFLIERALGFIKLQPGRHQLIVCIEKRNEQKNRILLDYFEGFVDYGTEFYSSDDMQVCNRSIEFRDKKDLVTGLELADICAYPIAWRELNQGRKHLTFDLIKSKLFRSKYGNVNGYGIKRFP